MTESRSALIVASQRYGDPKLRRLRAPAHDADVLAKVLADPKIGGFDVDVSLDEPEHAVRRKLAGFFKTRGRDDLLLLHFSCHGLKDEDGRLYFATPDTELEHLDATAVPAEFVNRLMDRSPSRRILLFLDCCYAGAFGKGAAHRAGSGVELKERFDGRGCVVLTASSSMEYAFEGDALTGEGTPSIFTSALVEGLRTGAADRDHDGFVSIDELYDYLYERVRRETPNQTPSKWTYDVQGDLVVARNPEGAVVTPAELPAALVDATESPIPYVREGSVQALAELLGSRNAPIALAARLALERLQTDDSRRVSSAAAAALREQAAPAAVPAAPPEPTVREQPPPTRVDAAAPPEPATREEPPPTRVEAGDEPESTMREEPPPARVQAVEEPESTMREEPPPARVEAVAPPARQAKFAKRRRVSAARVERPTSGAEAAVLENGKPRVAAWRTPAVMISAAAGAAFLLVAAGSIVFDASASNPARALFAGPIAVALLAPVVAVAWARAWVWPELAVGVLLGFALQAAAAAAGWIGGSPAFAGLLKDVDGAFLDLDRLRVFFPAGAAALVAAAVPAALALGAERLLAAQDDVRRGNRERLQTALALAGAGICFAALFLPLRQPSDDRHEILSEGALDLPWVAFEPVAALVAVALVAAAAALARGDRMLRAGLLLALGFQLFLYFAGYFVSVELHASGEYGPGGFAGMAGAAAVAAAGAVELRKALGHRGRPNT